MTPEGPGTNSSVELPQPRPIREFGPANAKEFAEIRSAGQPAIFRGQAAEWPAVDAARAGDDKLLAYLRRFSLTSSANVIIAPPECGGRMFYTDDLSGLTFRRETCGLGSLLEQLLQDRDDPSPHAYAVQAERVEKAFTGFEKENQANLLPAGTVPLAWIGNRVRVAPHYDRYENLGIVVAGRRHFTLFPPEQVANLYPGPFELTPAGTPVAMVDLHDPDLTRFPRYAEAARHAQSAILDAGDAIYIPYLWWHAVDSLEAFNLFISHWWSGDAQGGAEPYDAMFYALLALRGLPPERREAWRHMFDHYVFETHGDPGAHIPPQARGVLGAPSAEWAERLRQRIKKAAGSL